MARVNLSNLQAPLIRQYWQPYASWGITVEAGQTVSFTTRLSDDTDFDWGDGTFETLTPQGLQASKTYSSSGDYTIKILQPENVDALDLRTVASVSLVNSRELRPLVNLKSLSLFRLDGVGYVDSEDFKDLNITGTFYLFDLPNISVNINSKHWEHWRPSGNFYLYNLPLDMGVINIEDWKDWRPNNTVYIYRLLNTGGTIYSKYIKNWRPTSFYLHHLPNIYTEINSSDLQDWPLTGALYFYSLLNSKFTIIPESFNNYIECDGVYFINCRLTSDQINTILYDIYSMSLVRIASGGSINVSGATNAAPSGTYQPCQTSEVTPDTPGKEIAYELLHDTLGVGFNKWDTVTFND